MTVGVCKLTPGMCEEDANPDNTLEEITQDLKELCQLNQQEMLHRGGRRLTIHDCRKIIESEKPAEVMEELEEEGHIRWNTMVDSSGGTLSHRAARFGKLEVLKELAKRNVNLWKEDSRGLRPAHHAVGTRRPVILQFLLMQPNANLEAREIRGKTLIDLAAMYGCPRALDVLFSMGCWPWGMCVRDNELTPACKRVTRKWRSWLLQDANRNTRLPTITEHIMVAITPDYSKPRLTHQSTA